MTALGVFITKGMYKDATNFEQISESLYLKFIFNRF